ncbi:MAG TPA: cytochrome c oxidase assembly protein [Gemmatimonadota bacterium]|nr:cytochrome c oxidase assembly protein [Gemmatimonadota bacterium]
MQFWCSAQGIPWTWAWRPYVGVWVLVIALAFLYLRWTRAATGEWPSARSWRTASFAAALAALWLALDWPIGALAAGYLASLHMLQFLLVALVAPALGLLGIPDRAWGRLAARGGSPLILRLTHPVAAFLAFNLVVGLTHWPPVLDGLMGSQAGSFLIDMLWLGAGILLWWPVVAPFPDRPGFGYPLKIGYLIAVTITMTAPFLYLTFTALPVYATYELAPPIPGITKRQDQQLAGLLMKLGGTVVLWMGITTLFFRWYRGEEGSVV